MATFYEVVGRIIQPYKTIFLSVFLFVLFGVVAYFFYTYYLSNTINNRKYADVANMSGEKETILIYFFFADWCPHCKTAKPDWQQFTSKVNGTVVNGKSIKTVDVDCTDLENSADPAVTSVKQLISTYKVAGFPTVFAVKDDKKIDYDAKVSLTTLNKFAEAITQ